jgi:uncharacterized alpha-E superfamily protein
MGRLRAEMDYTSIEDAIEHGLHEYIDDFQIRLNRVGSAVREQFFVAQPNYGTPTATLFQE